MLCFAIVIAVVLPSFALNPGTQTKIDVTCRALDARNAADAFFKSFDDIVKYSITDDNNNKNFSMVRAFAGPILNYSRVANKLCYHDTVSPERDSLEFFKLTEFSLKNGRFKEFLDNGGAECINAIKAKIAKCVSDTIGHKKGADNKYLSLWEKTELKIENQTCRETNKIKLCTQDAMRNEGWYKCQYGNDNILYVGSLFDFMLERCNRLRKNWEKSGNNPAQMNLSVKSVLLSCLSTVLLVRQMTYGRDFK